MLLDAYVKKGEYETPLYIKEGEMIPERERVLVDIAEDAMVARASFLSAVYWWFVYDGR